MISLQKDCIGKERSEENQPCIARGCECDLAAMEQGFERYSGRRGVSRDRQLVRLLQKGCRYWLVFSRFPIFPCLSTFSVDKLVDDGGKERCIPCNVTVLSN